MDVARLKPQDSNLDATGEVRPEFAMQTVERVMKVLLAFTPENRSLGVTELADQLGLTKSAVHRILTSLVTIGFAQRDESSSRYRLGHQAIEVGLAALGRTDLRVVALPIMHDLVETTSETATVSLMVGFSRTYLAQVESPQFVRMCVDVGRRFPLYAGASGRAILAFVPPSVLESYLASMKLDRLTDQTLTSKSKLLESLKIVADAGYAVSSGERDQYAGAVAAPIFGEENRVIGCVSVCGPRERFGREAGAKYGRLVVEASREISRLL